MLQWSRVTSGMVLGDQEAPGRWVCRGRDCTSWGALPGGESVPSIQSCTEPVIRAVLVFAEVRFPSR